MVNLGSKVILAHFLHVPPASLAKNLQCAMFAMGATRHNSLDQQPVAFRTQKSHGSAWPARQGRDVQGQVAFSNDKIFYLGQAKHTPQCIPKPWINMATPGIFDMRHGRKSHLDSHLWTMPAEMFILRGQRRRFCARASRILSWTRNKLPLLIGDYRRLYYRIYWGFLQPICII